MLSLLDSDFKLLFFGGSRSSSPLALVLEVEGPEGLLKKEFICDICNENHEEQQQQHSNAMILTRKRLLVDIFVSRRISKTFAFCEFVCVNFEPWYFLVNSSRISSCYEKLYCVTSVTF